MIVATGPLMAEPTLRREGAFRSKFEEAALLTYKKDHAAFSVYT